MHFSLVYPPLTYRFCCHLVSRPGQPDSPSCFGPERLRPPPHSGIDCHRSHCPSENYDGGEDMYPLLQYPRQRHRCPHRRTEPNCPTCPSPESSLESLFVFLSRVPCPVSCSTQHKQCVPLSHLCFLEPQNSSPPEAKNIFSSRPGAA